MLKSLLATCLMFAVRGNGQELRIFAGITDHQVLQRAAGNAAHLSLEGTAPPGVVEARILARGLEVPGLGWSAVARVEQGRWRGQIATIPAGGPYRLELRVQGAALAVEDILVGDLWILGGQSNMQGCGNLDHVEPPTPLVHSFDLSDRWLLAQEPLHRFIDAVDSVHWDGKPRAGEAEAREEVRTAWRGTGLGLPFAAEMVRRTGVPVGLIPSAHGGSTMAEWDPALRNRGGASLYGSMLRRVRAAGGTVAGMLWYQGESESFPQEAAVFQEKFDQFVAAVRADLQEPQLPFYYVQIGRFVTTETRRTDAAWNRVQDLQRRAELDLPHAGMVAAVDAGLDDSIHLNTEGLRTVGRRLANLACHDLFPSVESCRALRPGPRPAGITVVRHPFRDEYMLRVSFTGVNVPLRSSGRVSGFSVHAPDGGEMPVIFNAEVDPNDPAAVLLRIHVRYSFGTDELPRGASLWYGHGKDPYCNLTDAAGMAVPVFGPLPVPPPR